MINAYVLQGVEEEYCLVFKTDDSEAILRIIKRLCQTRDKDLRELGERLEEDLNDRLRQDTSGPRPKDSRKVQKRK